MCGTVPRKFGYLNTARKVRYGQVWNDRFPELRVPFLDETGHNPLASEMLTMVYGQKASFSRKRLLTSVVRLDLHVNE